MKQFVLMSVLTCLGGVGSLFHPFWGILLYYTFAVLRPQYLWEWALPMEVRWSLIAAVIVILGVVLNINKLILRNGLNAVAWLMGVFGFWLLLSIITSDHPGSAMAWGEEYAKILLIALIASMVIHHLWQIEVIAAMVLVVIGYLAWEVNYLYLFQGRLDIYHHGFGGLDNNGAGLMLAMGLPIAYAFAVAAKKVWQKILAGALGLLMIHATLMSFSRGAMVAALIAGVWLLLHHRPRIQAGLIAAVLSVAVLMLAGDEIRNRFLSTGNYAYDDSARSRLANWEAGWQIAKAHPLTGVGIRNSSYYMGNYGADRAGRTIHSQYIQIAADSGIPALLIYVALLGTAIVYLRKTRTLIDAHLDEEPADATDDPTRMTLSLIRAIALGCEASLVLFATGAIFLSLEMFELPWILLVMAGVMPGVVGQYLKPRAAESRQLLIHNPKPPVATDGSRDALQPKLGLSKPA